MNIMDLVGKRVEKEVKFMNGKVTISKLTVSQVKEVQAMSEALKDNPESGFDIMKLIVKSSVSGGERLEDEHFDGFPMDELATLSQEIMKHSGVSGEENKAGK